VLTRSGIEKAIDIQGNTPQYLGLGLVLTQYLGTKWNNKGPASQYPLKGKIVHGGNMPAKKKAAKKKKKH
jgi:hypothetical protein